jgi:hypothetical protein
MDNINHLENWLLDELFKARTQILEYTQWKDTELYQNEISKLELRAHWIQIQYDELINKNK